MPPKPLSSNPAQFVVDPEKYDSNYVSGFTQVSGLTVRPRLIISVQGSEGGGKSHFAMSAPGPIYHQNADFGTEGVIDKFNSRKEIHKADYSIVLPESVQQLEGAAYMDSVANLCNPKWESFKRDFRFALPRARSVVWDTADEFWELIRLARFGKLDQIKAHHYGPVNREYRDLINEAYSSDCNLIMLHKMKDEYVNDKRTGALKRTGFKDADYAAQVAVRSFKQDGQFYLEVIKCRLNTDIEGMTIPQSPDTGFADLAQMVLPQFEREQWL